MVKKKLKFFFIIQGEGRGHLTQALALRELLIRSGYEICGVMVGTSKRREIPSFFISGITEGFTTFESPNFLLDKNKKSIRVVASIFYNLKKGRAFLKSIGEIKRKVEKDKPDVIINFYELSCGLYFLLHRPTIKHITLSHHYLLHHPDFATPPGIIRDKILMRLHNRLTSSRADTVLSLSFRKLKETGETGISIIPPLLRREIKSLIPENGDFVLCYILNEGYAEEIIRWHTENKTIVVHCFWDKKDVEETYSAWKNLTFHKLDSNKFLNFLKSCKGFVSTAGFESVCEAMYLGKPVMVVPTGGHYEQMCNALDAVESGAGISAPSFNLQVLLNYLPNHTSVQKDFKAWVDQAEPMIINHLERILEEADTAASSSN